MGTIRVLPELITNQIAAGEVVERPVSVVKELMENALDAGARHITVEVERGGRDLIRVSDDGHGMSRDNALLSIERYATSKIATADDLFSISTLGFRGEALPSMASVSKMTIISRERDADYGTRLFLSGGKLMEVSEIGAPPGTVVEVRNLYFNTPVRRKFLKTVNTEMGHIADAFSAMAMGAKDVGFSLIHNGRPVKEVPADLPLAARVATVLANDPNLALYAVAYRGSDVAIEGFIAHPSHDRAGSQRIRIFVNGRMVTDRGAISALVQGYRGRLMKGRFPLAVLFMTLPCDAVDVNVHPAKLQVRFVNEKAVYHAVRQSVLKALEQAEQKNSVTPEKEEPTKDSGEFHTSDPSEAFSRNHRVQAPVSVAVDDESDSCSEGGAPCDSSHESGKAKTVRDGNRKSDEDKPAAGLFQWGPSGPQSSDPDSLFTSRTRFRGEEDPGANPEESVQEEAGQKSGRISRESSFRFPKGVSGQKDLDAFQVSERVSSGETLKTKGDKVGDDMVMPDLLGSEMDARREDDAVPPDFRIVGQVMGTYIIVEKNSGMELIDQHAAHERIMYEQLKGRSRKFTPPSQQLIVPHMLEFNFSQSALFERLITVFAALGFEIEPFGERTYAVKSVPAIIDAQDVETLLQDMVDRAVDAGFECDESGMETSGWLDECLIMMACHHSVRANQTLTEEEMCRLVVDLDGCENAFYCPHGRPIRVEWSQKDFDRMFRRVV